MSLRAEKRSAARWANNTATGYLQRLQNESKTTRSTEQQRALRSIIALFGATTGSSEQKRALRSKNDTQSYRRRQRNQANPLLLLLLFLLLSMLPTLQLIKRLDAISDATRPHSSSRRCRHNSDQLPSFFPPISFLGTADITVTFLLSFNILSRNCRYNSYHLPMG